MRRGAFGWKPPGCADPPIISPGLADATLDTGAAYLRIGCFATDAVDLYAEGGYRRILGDPEFTKGRVAIGTNWQLSSWLELLPQLLVEHSRGRGSEVLMLAQVHLIH